MKIKVLRSAMLDGLKNVTCAVNDKSIEQIMQNIKMETVDGNGVYLFATDSKISCGVKVKCEVIEAGSTTLPSRMLFNSVNVLREGEVDISVDESTSRGIISQGVTSFRLAGKPAEDYPLPPEKNGITMSISASVFKDLIRRVSYAQCTQTTRENLICVLLEVKDGNCAMVACDGKRFSKAWIGGGTKVDGTPLYAEDFSCSIPSTSVSVLQKIVSDEGEIYITFGNGLLYLEMTATGITMTTKLLATEYPDYTRVLSFMEAEPSNAKVDKELFINALNMVSAITRDEFMLAKIKFADNTVHISVNGLNGEKSTTEVPVKYDGPEYNLNFNPRFLVDPLKAIPDDEVDIELRGNTSPIVYKTGDAPFLAMVMPVRVNEEPASN